VARRASALTTPDITGGMAGKIVEAVAAASSGIPVYFVNLTKDERLEKVGLGHEVICSQLLPK
jgi:isopentenyl phosphate kinase